VNFLIVNGGVVAPSFGCATDEPARAVLERLFPDRAIAMVPGREILLGGGNIHCITQQQPRRTRS
jgi:agmatine deiminase